MKRLWLLFAQAVTVLLAAYFVVGTLKPLWLGQAAPSSIGNTISIFEAPPPSSSNPVTVGSFSAAVLALSLFSACQVAEITRGAITSVHYGQMEAARAIGLTFSQCLLSVIFPQAVRRFLPPWINSVTDTVKGSALVSLLGIVDLMLAIQQVIGRTYRPMPFYVLGAIVYLCINYALSVASRRLEAHYAYVRD